MFMLKPDFRVEYNSDGIKKLESIYNLYNNIKINYSDIYNLLPEASTDKYRTYLRTGEILIYASPCQLWIEMEAVFMKSINGLCILTERSVKISGSAENYTIPLAEIGAVTIESNYKLQIYNDRSNTLKQITFENDSALKWQDILVAMLSERFSKQIITR